jgi:SAM-dependent methyltransferase
MMAPSRRRRNPLSLVQQEADVRFYLHRLEECGGDSVLVLGAANGRVAWELARHAARVVAVEPSERMVGLVETLRKDYPSEISARLRVQNSDLRSLRMGETFSLVAAPQNALGLLGSHADLEAFVTTVRMHLKPEGLFAFDVLNPSPPFISKDDPPHGPEPIQRVFTPHFAESRGEARGNPLRRWKRRLFDSRELDETLRAGGLTPRERYGHFDGKVFEPKDTIQVVVAELSSPEA